MAEYLIKDSTLLGIAEAIRGKTGSSDPIAVKDMAAQIEGITGGGGSADGCVTVTFMNGEDVLFSRPVYIGDDCPDPIAQGHIATTPTKDSTEQYHYTFYGWGASDEGAADDTILKNITEDKTVYAVFTATVRTYTITWLDADGVTVLPGQTQWAYGTMPSNEVEKEGVSFDKWTPTPVEVTGDATYTASWVEKITFAGGSWEDIIRIANEGKASEYFKVGDTKNVEINGHSIPFMIVGFNHDTLATGSGKAAISLVAKQLYPVAMDHSMTYCCRSAYGESATNSLGYSINRLQYNFSDATLRSALKQVKKPAEAYANSFELRSDYTAKVWIPSFTEMGGNGYSMSSDKYNVLGTKYAAFTSTTDARRTVAGGDGSYAAYRLRNQYNNSANTIGNNPSAAYGTNQYRHIQYSEITTHKIQYPLLGFCI